MKKWTSSNDQRVIKEQVDRWLREERIRKKAAIERKRNARANRFSMLN